MEGAGAETLLSLRRGNIAIYVVSSIFQVFHPVHRVVGLLQTFRVNSLWSALHRNFPIYPGNSKCSLQYWWSAKCGVEKNSRKIELSRKNCTEKSSCTSFYLSVFGEKMESSWGTLQIFACNLWRLEWRRALQKFQN